ncbi:MAG: DNA methyltransferase [Spirochaetota bacterium]|nr:DNA methyltransferase [Spirochaetota bacterium]
MTQAEQQKAAKQFAEYWEDRGDEKQETQRYWIGLLGDVLGIANATNYIEFEKKVKLKHTSFIDAYISGTKVLIEQKGSKIDLTKPQEQSDGAILTPFGQAKRYADELPYDLRPRWIVVSNFAEIHIHDMNNPHAEPEIVKLENLEKEYYRLSFLAEQEHIHIKREMEVSIKAGNIVGLIYDKLLAQYKLAKNVDMEKCLKSLNMLCVRLVFCLYAEDAGIFGHKSIFGDYLNHFEAKDLRNALINLFKVLDQKPEDRDPFLEEELAVFPYVNGGLFTEEDQFIPPFTGEIKDLLIKKASDDFDWSDISPTIFGAVFESTLNPETRRTGGMHYTSIENIHKVIDPLFMDELNAEFEKILEIKQTKNKEDKLINFQKKLSTLKFLDPACGSGNFLTETYLSLRRLENKILEQILKGGQMLLGFNDDWKPIEISIGQFYGIEINDFAVTVAKTSLWIAENQMMKETEKLVEKQLNFLPLKSYANIVEGNALRMDWETFEVLPEIKNIIYADKANIYKVDSDKPMIVCEPTSKYENEVNIVTKEVEFKDIEELQTSKTISVSYDYIMGNPPFVGARFMDKRQKEDLLLTFGKDWTGAGDLDYVCCWYKKTLDLIQEKSTRCAFVSTNSISQGSSVSNLWKPLFENGLHFDYAYQTFKWVNETADKKNMAAVHCVIIGFSVAKNDKPKIIFDSAGNKSIAKNINGYLQDSPNVFIENRKKPICNVTPMLFGSMPNDGRNLIIEAEEYDDFIKNDPASQKYIRQFLGAEEFINNKKRYCLWLENVSPAEMRKMPLVGQRVTAVRKLRESSSRGATRRLADIPHLFGEIRQPKEGNYLLVPRVSSERRKYVPIGFLSSEIIASDATQIIPNASLYEFGILTSLVHNAWMRIVAGRLKSDYRYSASIVYNNFPWCKPTDEQKVKIEKTAQAILDARAKYPESSLADLYDETFMPADLRKAHQANDRAVMEAYHFDKLSDRKFDMTESEIVAELFKMYEKLTEGR